MRIFCVNGKSYKAAPISFNTICELEEMGFSLDEMLKKPTRAIRAYFAVCAGVSIAEAGNEIEKHIIENGEMPNIAEVFVKEAEESDFFRSLTKVATKEATTDEKK